MAALVAAGAGARVVKHGNRAASSQCGSADVLEALGVPIELGPAGVERCVAEVGIGFCLAQRYHPALRFMGPARRELGVPTTFNFLGPLANPARVRRQAVGVADPAMAERVVAVLQANGAEHAWVFYGDDGLDELTTTTTSTVYELRDGDVRRFTLDPADSASPAPRPVICAGGDATTNADAVRAVLDGKPGAVRDVALVNAAAALVVGRSRRRVRRRARAGARVDRQRRGGPRARRLAAGRGRGSAEAERRAECPRRCSVPTAGIRRCSTTSAAVTTFRCGGCGRALKVPAQFRAPSRDAPGAGPGATGRRRRRRADPGDAEVPPVPPAPPVVARHRWVPRRLPTTRSPVAAPGAAGRRRAVAGRPCRPPGPPSTRPGARPHRRHRGRCARR